MDAYINYFDLLHHAAAQVLAVTGYTLVGLVVTWLCGSWMGLLLTSQERSDATRNPLHDWVLLHPAIIAAGWATLITASILSFYLTKSMLAGEVLLAVVATVSCVSLWRQKPRFQSSHYVAFAVVGLLTLLMGLWQHAATGLPVSDKGDFLAFSDLQLDLTVHTTMAGLVQQNGLPMISMWASPTATLAGVQHIGHITAIAAFSEILGVSLYTASTVNWIIATMLTGWCALALLFKKAKPNLVYGLVGVLATLVIGQFTPPWLHDPTHPRAPLVTGIWVASRSYWNISQAISIALTFGGLVVLDWYSAQRRHGAGQLLVLAAAVSLITVGGLVKPSLVIFFGPALIIWLAVSRARAAESLVTVAVLGLGAMIYYLPSFLSTSKAVAPASAGWTLALDQEQMTGVALFLWHACLALAIVVGALLARSIARGWRDRKWQTLDLVVIALVGSVLFALFFRENRFVGFITLQPNIWWGISACVMLLVPLAFREVPKILKWNIYLRWVVVVGLAVGAVQVVNGAYVAWVYPTLHFREHEAILAETLETARQLTAPKARLGLDLSLDNLDLRPYLSRPTLLPLIYASQADKEAYSRWRTFLKSGKADPPLDRLDAVVLNGKRTYQNQYFRKLGWQGSNINERYRLWLRPNVSSKASPGSH